MQVSLLISLSVSSNEIQMPRGVPVATVAINNATNTGLLAVRMLRVGDADLQVRLLDSLSFSFSFSLSFCVLRVKEKKSHVLI